MKHSLITLCAIIPMALPLSGCVVSVGGNDEHSFTGEFGDREYKNRRIIADLNLNVTQSYASKLLGVADFSEKYQKNNDNIEVVYYRTHRVHKDDLTTKDECTYLYFVNGYLVKTGMGQNNMGQNIKAMD